LSRVGAVAVMTEPKQERARVTRQRLLEASVACLAETGWEASTVGAIAQRAGISRGAAQHHFPTRESLVLASITYAFEEQRRRLEELAAVTGTSRSVRVRQAVAALVDLYCNPQFKAAIQVWTAAAADPALRAQVIPLERQVARAAHATAVRLLGADAEDARARPLIQATLDLARGLALADLLTDDSRRRRRVVEAWAAQLDLALAD
jgi:AcrR family transcriptional regulator